MARSTCLLLWICLFPGACASPAPPLRPPAPVELVGEHMGTRFRVLVHHQDRTRGLEAARAALERVGELDRALSDYRAESELCRLSAAAGGPAVACSPELMEVLRLGQEVAQLSGGAFDVTVGPAVRLWRRAARRGVLPDPEDLEAARRRMGPDLLELDLEAGTARCTVPGMRLDLGGIAKGLALDEALGVLRQQGASAGLVDGGGDVAAFGAPPGAEGWTVALEELGPRAALTLADGAVATSGDRYQGWELEGLRRSHLVDPRTAEALVGARSAGVLATDGALADALASALCVLGVEEGLDLLERLPGVEGWVAEEGIRGGEPCLSSGMLRRMRVPPGADSTPSGRSPQPREP